MDEARAVIARLGRIDELEERGAPPAELLEEVRGLLSDAEAWVRSESAGTDLAETALERCRDALQKAEPGKEVRAGLW